MTSHIQNLVNNWPWTFETIQFGCLAQAFQCSITMLSADEKPDISYRYRSSWRHKWRNDDVIELVTSVMTHFSDIGGLDTQKQEVREAVELPLTHYELYKQIGIDPPRGVLMYGPPGCGKVQCKFSLIHDSSTRWRHLIWRHNFRQCWQRPLLIIQQHHKSTQRWSKNWRQSRW